MILRSCYELNIPLSKEMTVKEFIEDIIEKDEDRFLKYYSIYLEENLSSRNMILHFEKGMLKSHHSSFCRMDYEDYLKCKIVKKYGTGYIKVDNIAEWNRNYDAPDYNKPNSNEKFKKEKLEKLTCKFDMESREERIKEERKKKINKVRWCNDIGKIEYKDLVECVHEMIWQLDEYSLEQYSINDELGQLKRDNKRIHSQLSWLEYKIDLSSKKEYTKKRLAKTLVNTFKFVCIKMGISKETVLKLMQET